MSYKTTDTGQLIGHPSICFNRWEIRGENNTFFVNFIDNFLKIDFLQYGLIDLST